MFATKLAKPEEILLLLTCTALFCFLFAEAKCKERLAKLTEMMMIELKHLIEFGCELITVFGNPYSTCI